MNTYIMTIRLEGTVRVEDPHCPASWMGSGCYDIDVPAYSDGTLTVNAESEEDARQYAMDYEYDDILEEVHEIDIRGIEIDDTCAPGEQNEGIVDIDFDEPEIREAYEPDPDEEYERRREMRIMDE